MIPIYAAGHVVGEVRGGVFKKRVKGSVHMLRRPRGWALDVQSLIDAQQAGGATRVEIHDTESSRTYQADVAKIWRDGIRFDRGHGAQIVLPLEQWQTVSGRSVPRQLSLFEGRVGM